VTGRLGGYMGRILSVDLGSGSVVSEGLDQDLLRHFIGGYGLAARILYERTPPGLDALGPESTLGFVTGPLTGTPAIMANRFVVAGKSPLTGGWGDANAGGKFGPKLKGAGYDAVFIRGIADQHPCYLFIDNGEAVLLDGSSLWGLTTSQTEEALRKLHGNDIEVVCIGPAGERVSLISAVMTDGGRAAARSGLGAVMGSKRLKAIAVKGALTPHVADPARVKELREIYLPGFTADGSPGILLRSQGTAGFAPMLIEIGRTPIKNFKGAYPDDFPSPEKLGGQAFEPYISRKYGCWGCNQVCGAILAWAWDGKEREGHRPEYETLGTCGTYCGIDDPLVVMEMNSRCNEAGLDTISAGATIAFAMECFENGLLTEDQLDGLDPQWGDGVSALDLLDRMITREGLGDVLADGTAKAARLIGQGSEQFAMNAGGQELPAHDARQTQGFGLMYQISPTPGRHTQGGAGYELLTDVDLEQLRIKATDRTTRPSQFGGRAFRVLTAWQNTLNAAGFCHFGAMSMDRLYVPRFIAAVVGWDFGMDECIRTGERIETIRHCYGVREGYNPLETRAPDRAFGRPPLTKGPIAGRVVDVDSVRRAYLRQMGWDPQSGVPNRARLGELGLADLIGLQ
jgi:aldehyde:ferredoxin oxidoreductase